MKLIKAGFAHILYELAVARALRTLLQADCEHGACAPPVKATEFRRLKPKFINFDWNEQCKILK